MRVQVTCLLLAAALAGCMEGTEKEGGGEVFERFDQVAVGIVPSGWTTQNGGWSVVENATARSPTHVLQGIGSPDPGFSALLPPGSWDDLDLQLDFVMVSGGGGQVGDIPQGAGVLVHRSDEKNFQIIRYSATEKEWHLFTVKDGTRNKKAEATVEGGTDPVFGQWVHLSVASSDGHVVVKDGATKVLDFQVPDGHSRSGSAGPFVRGDTVAYFDNLEIDP